MANHQKPLPRYAKFVVGLLYAYLFIYALILPIEVFDPDYFSIPTPADGIFFITTEVLLIVLTALTIYFIHKRKELAPPLIVMTIFIGYGLSSLPFGAYASETSPVVSAVTSSAFLVIDTIVILYIMTSKEIRRIFKN